MQILLTEAAYAREGATLETLLPDADFVRVPAPDSFILRDEPLPRASVDPEIIWLSYDTWQTGLLSTLMNVALEGSPRWVQSHTAGLDNPAFHTIMGKGARLTKNAGQAVPIAEYVLAHALSLMVPLEAQATAQVRRDWSFIPYREVAGSTWLVVGWGAIGHEIAVRALAFGAKVKGVRRSPGPDDLVGETYAIAELPRLLPEADVVVLACPLTEETRRLANASFFAAMKPGAILLNIARGGLVDIEALRAALDRDRPARAVLDVFEAEPLPAGSWLWDHPKVRVTAHTSWAGDGYRDRMDARFVENVRRYVAGERLLNEAAPHEASPA